MNIEAPATRWHLRLLAVSVLPALLMVGLLAWVFLERYRLELDAALVERGKSLARQIEQAAEYALFANDTALIRQLIEAIVNNDKDVATLQLYDRNGSLIAASGKLRAAQLLPPTTLVVTNEDNRLVILAPIRATFASVAPDPWDGEARANASVPLGALRLEISRARLEARRQEMMQVTIAVVLAGILLASWISAHIARDILERLDVARQRMREQKEIAEVQARTDALTGLPNRRVFDAALEREIQRALRRGETLALVLTDIDRFKAINDRLGHAAGDEVLVDFARTLRAMVREIDLVGRWGGEEFVILMPGTSLAEARLVAERLRDAVATSQTCVAGETLSYTASSGVAVLEPGCLDARSLFMRADAALYRAKEMGRNRVEAAGSS